VFDMTEAVVRIALADQISHHERADRHPLFDSRRS
jgi:hypothetical protein